MRVAKILPIPVDYNPNVMSTQNSLAQKGYYVFPGTAKGLVPLKDSTSGKFLTGLDEDAKYIDMIPDEAGRNAEREIVRDRRLRLEKATGLDLGPRSEYYSGVYGKKYNTGETATRVKLLDRENIFNFTNPLREVEFWWVIQWKNLIAPSLEEYKKGRLGHAVQYYVSNIEAEASVVYSEKKAANECILKLDKMSLEKRKKVAKLLGLAITDDSKEEIVYNLLDTFIKSGNISIGEYKGQRSVTLFNSISGISDKLLNARGLVKDALTYRVFIEKHGVVYEGDQIIANTKEELIKDISLDGKQMEYMALESKVADKKKLRSGLI